MEKDRPLILIHSEMKYHSAASADGVNIMLTPQFYTVKREALPVQYGYQAKRIAPSLFEGLLENAHEYKYFVDKEEDYWLFIAYDAENIKSFLTSKGIEIANVSKMFFAEQSISDFKKPVLLGEKDALANLDGCMTIIPQFVLQEEEPMQFDASFTPKKGVVLEGRSSSILEDTEAYTLAFILALFAMIYFVEGSRYINEDVAQKEEINLLLEDYPSLQSSYTRESIATKYKAIDKKERKKRDIIKALSDMIFKGSVLTSLIMDDKKFEASFTCENDSIKKKLKNLVKKEKFSIKEIPNSSNLKIGGSL